MIKKEIYQLNEIETMSRLEKTLTKYIGLIVMVIGLIFSAMSIDFSSPIAALIGATLILWGGILLYIKVDKLIRADVLQRCCGDLYEIIDAYIEGITITDKPIYFTENSIDKIDQVYLKIKLSNEKELIVKPPGIGLHKIIEKELKMNFTTTEFNFVSQKIEKIIVNELDLAKDIKIYQGKSLDEIKVVISENIFTEINHKQIHELLGDPLTSAIACIITRSKNTKVKIEKIDKDNRIMNVKFMLIDK